MEFEVSSSLQKKTITGGECDIDTPFSRQEMRAFKKSYIKSGGTLMHLMEVFAEKISYSISESMKPTKTLVLCGPGRNGGDGFAVARLLAKRGFKVTVAIDTASDHPQSPEVQAQRNAWYGKVYDFSDVNFKDYKLLVDGLFGLGLLDNLRASYLNVVHAVNKSKAHVISIDIPSGLDADTGQVRGEAIRANTTFSFHRPKQGMLLNQAADYTGKIIVKTL